MHELILAASVPHMEDQPRAQLMEQLTEQMLTPEEYRARIKRNRDSLRAMFPARKV